MTVGVLRLLRSLSALSTLSRVAPVAQASFVALEHPDQRSWHICLYAGLACLDRAKPSVVTI
jgi:hypothetical protein